MLRVFSLDMADPEKFVIILELVPGIHSKGKSFDNVIHAEIIPAGDLAVRARLFLILIQ